MLRSPTALGHEAAGAVVAGDGPLPAGTPVAIEPAIPCERCRACRAGRYNQCPHGRCFGSPPTHGALTGHLAVPAEFAHPLPDDFPLTSGALIEPLAVALHAVRRGGVTAGDRVLVTGAGPIGLLVLQAARAVGAGETVVTDINPGRLAHARRLGADRVLETSREPLPQEPLFDIALDCSGVEAALAAAAHAVRPGGSLVAVGNPPQPRTALPLAWMQRQELSLVTAFRYAGEFPAAVSLAATGRDDAVHRRRGRPAPHRGPRDPRRGRRAAFPAQAQEPQLPGPLQLHRHSAPGRHPAPAAGPGCSRAR
ncbi:hypothetical protein GCM10010376_42280 [Streptomyces violaceusniger]